MTITFKKRTLIAVIVSLFLIIGAATILLNPRQEKSLSTKDDTQVISANQASGGVTNRQQAATMGAVTVDIEPKILSRTASKNIFSVAFNTHSVDLDFDFTKIISLKDDLGNTYPALEWTGNRGWHHVSGDIIFPKINKQASQVTLEISEIEGQAKSFNWPVDNF